MNEQKIIHYINHGIKDKDWYHKCTAMFIELFGFEKLHLVSELFAATSINSSLKSNIRLFRKALHQIENNLPFTNYLPVMFLQLERIRAGEPIQGRKITSFAAAMRGDINAVVVDTWLLRAFELDRKYYRKESQTYRNAGATDKDYSTIERWCRDYAEDNGYEARQVSAMIWCGIRSLQSKEIETNYHNILRFQLYSMFENTKEPDHF